MRHWYEWMPRRWNTEQEIARRYMRGVTATISSVGRAMLRGQYPLVSQHGHIYDVYGLRIVYPHDFLPIGPTISRPDGSALHPSVFQDSHRGVWTNGLDSHIEAHWRLCLYVPGEVDIDFRSPAALERMFEAIHTFLFRERLYQRDLAEQEQTGIPPQWPGPQRSHGAAGLWEAIRDRGGLGPQDLCICGSGRPFDRCHKNEVDDHARQVVSTSRTESDRNDGSQP